jgi:hypothetical protein
MVQYIDISLIVTQNCMCGELFKSQAPGWLGGQKGGTGAAGGAGGDVHAGEVTPEN